MIGNDIVDLMLAKAENNWNRGGYLDKIFTLKEQRYIYDSKQPAMMVWLMWSMKESAYKLHVQLYKKRFFAPKKFSCTLLNLNEKESCGRVVFDDFQCFTESELSGQFVHSISRLENNKDYLSRTFKLKNSKYETQHIGVYNRAIAQFTKFSLKPSDLISLKKDDHGIPIFYFNKDKADVSVSMTHHGNYGAFVINNYELRTNQKVNF